MKATKYQQKSQIRLEDLLRRRKSTLNQFMKDRGITTYEGLDGVCKRLGVLTPNQGSFIECVDHYVSNPAAGVVVVPPSVVIAESTGSPELDVEDNFEDLQPQISVTDESGEKEISIVLQEAMVTVSKSQSKKQRKRIKKNHLVSEVKGEV
jgi:hypothetical protein